MGVLGSAPATDPVVVVDHHRDRGLTTRHVVDVRCFIKDLSECLEGEACRCTIDNWPKASDRGTNTRPHVSKFSDGWEINSVWVLAKEITNHRAMRCQPKKVLAHKVDTIITLHRSPQGLNNSFRIKHFAHRSISSRGKDVFKRLLGFGIRTTKRE